MKKSALVTLIIAIVLIVLGIGLSVYGAFLGVPQSYYHHYDHGFISYHVRYISPSMGSGSVARDFGHMIFNGGLVALAISFILNIHKEKEDPETKKREAEADRREAVKARAEAVDATVHETAEESKAEKDKEENS